MIRNSYNKTFNRFAVVDITYSTHRIACGVFHL